ncbi:MAG TPA: efflux RND transporter periplasmic adaptor subunit [Humisphaera sp.]|jgi:RND family efflux transporter MFP subunit|nr:efflux RND transporter periplasmic adaptor subunit [Humisphaera sp.]
MNAHLDQLVSFSHLVWESLLRASLEGGVALLLVWFICRIATRLPGRAKCWLWRLAYLKLLLALFWATPMQLPLLRARPLPIEPAQAFQSAPRIDIQLADQGAPVLATVHPSPRHLSRADRLALTIGGAWIVGALAMLLKLAAQWNAARLLRRGSSCVADERLIAACEELAARAGRGRVLFPPPVLRGRAMEGVRATDLRAKHCCSTQPPPQPSPGVPGEGEEAPQNKERTHRTPQMRIGTRITSPLLVGVLKPVILLPQSVLEMPAHQLRLILAHEIAHAARRDIAWRIFATLIESLFFFHPIVWLSRRESNLAQELAADEMAMELTHASPRDYGVTLLSIAARGTAPRLSLATPIVTSPRTLERRLIAMRNPIHWSSRRFRVAANVVAFIAAVMLPRWRLVAQETGKTGNAPAVQEQRTEPVRATQAPPTPSTGTATAPRRIELAGVLRAGKKVQIQARVDGFVKTVEAKDGDIVKPGQALIALDDAVEQLQVGAAAAEYKEKQSEAAQKQKAREQVVQGRYPGATEVEVEQSRLDADIARARLQLAEQELAMMHLAAPIGGVIEFDHAHSIGEYVTRGTTLATIFDPGDARLELYVPQTSLQQVRVGLPVEATTKAYPGERFTGRIAFISSEADAATGLIRAAADIANPKQLPLAGRAAEVTIAVPAAREGELR